MVEAKSSEGNLNIFGALLFYCPPIAFPRAAKQVLADAGLANEAKGIWAMVLQQRASLKAQRPAHSPGVNLVLRYLEWDCALYRVTQQFGLTAEAAGQLIETINWKIFQPAIALSFALTRLLGKQRLSRVRWMLDLMFGLLFTSPFERRAVPLTKGVAFDVVVCPLAQYCQAQGVPELTRYAACQLDYQMATLWGVALHRSRTIAAGDAHCDFRFKL